MNRRSFIGGVLASFAAATALARTKLVIVNDGAGFFMNWAGGVIRNGNRFDTIIMGNDVFHIASPDGAAITWNGETLSIRGNIDKEIPSAT